MKNIKATYVVKDRSWKELMKYNENEGFGFYFFEQI
jgi:hypothetical protein